MSVDAHETQALAVQFLGDGRLVALPTETVYGLAADATSGEAVARIFEAKGRPQFNPLICHVSSLAMAEQFAAFDDTARALADKFWPGPLTLVLPLKDSALIHPLVTAGLTNVGIRFPRGVAAKIIEALGKPVAAPSANRSGKISPTSAEAVKRSLGNRVDLIVDDGPSAVGLESTIVKIEDGVLTLLRPGTVTIEEIERAAGVEVATSNGSTIEAPGMMKSHYAPDAKMRLNARHVEPGEALLAFGSKRIDGSAQASNIENLSETADMIEAAANLFSMMAKLDESGATSIAVEPIPSDGIGLAINDRLTRAAAPRESGNA